MELFRVGGDVPDTNYLFMGTISDYLPLITILVTNSCVRRLCRPWLLLTRVISSPSLPQS